MISKNKSSKQIKKRVLGRNFFSNPGRNLARNSSKFYRISILILFQTNCDPSIQFRKRYLRNLQNVIVKF